VSDRDLIDRFSDNVDQLLQTGVWTDPVDTITDEYAGALSVAQTLSSIDFSKESKKRYTIRQRLLAKIDTRESWSHKVKERIFMHTLFQKHRGKPAYSVIILVVFLGILFANLIWPGSVVAAAQSAVSFVQRIWIGEFTSLNPFAPDQIVEMEDGTLAMQGESLDKNQTAGTVSQHEGFTVEFEVLEFENLTEAQAILPFQLVQPSYLPQAYIFDYVKVIGEGDLASANLHFTGPDGDLLLSQRPVGDQTGKTVSIGLPEDYVVEPVQVNGQSATWAEHVLMWEANGVSYLLSSPNLSLTDAIQIAESIKYLARMKW
jgi:hypothetical protein